MSATPVADPRTLVTPDAFSISRDVLGRPLASPARRLGALVVDLVLVGVLTLLGWRILALVAAILLFRAAMKGAGEAAIGKAFRGSLGCLGGVIVFALFVSGGGFVSDLLTDRGDDSVEVQTTGGTASAGVMDLIGGLGSVRDLRQAESETAAEEAAFALARRLRDFGTDERETRETLLAAAGEPTGWDPDEVVDRAMARLEDGPTPDETTADGGEPVAPPAIVDSLERLRGTIGDLQSALQRQERRNRDLEEEIEDRSTGLFGWAVNTADQLGLTFGWGAIYFAFLLSWFSGLTPGKKLFGIRVVRLDGKRMTWFLAFERSGGYAAGFATGLLGFAQVFWDPNRQGIHDKIAGTVVVRDVPTPGRRSPVG